MTARIWRTSESPSSKHTIKLGCSAMKLKFTRPHLVDWVNQQPGFSVTEIPS
jgi:hypothetical protein